MFKFFQVFSSLIERDGDQLSRTIFKQVGCIFRVIDSYKDLGVAQHLDEVCHLQVVDFLIVWSFGFIVCLFKDSARS